MKHQVILKPIVLEVESIFQPIVWKHSQEFELKNASEVQPESKTSGTQGVTLPTLVRDIGTLAGILLIALFAIIIG